MGPGEVFPANMRNIKGWVNGLTEMRISGDCVAVAETRAMGRSSSRRAPLCHCDDALFRRVATPSSCTRGASMRASTTGVTHTADESQGAATTSTGATRTIGREGEQPVSSRGRQSRDLSAPLAWGGTGWWAVHMGCQTVHRCTGGSAVGTETAAGSAQDWSDFQKSERASTSQRTRVCVCPPPRAT